MMLKILNYFSKSDNDQQNLPKFDMEKIKIEQRNLVENDEYDSLMIIRDVPLKYLFKFNLSNIIIIWINNDINIFYKKKIGFKGVLEKKEMEGKVQDEQEYSKEDLLYMIQVEKFINYDKRSFKKEYLNKKKSEEKKKLKDDFQKQETLITNGEYTFKIELEYIGKISEEEKNIYFLKGYNRYIVKYKNTNDYVMFINKDVDRKINNVYWKVKNIVAASIEEQLNILKLYKEEKKVILWKDWSIWKNMIMKEKFLKADMFIYMSIVIATSVISLSWEWIDYFFLDSVNYDERIRSKVNEKFLPFENKVSLVNVDDKWYLNLEYLNNNKNQHENMNITVKKSPNNNIELEIVKVDDVITQNSIESIAEEVDNLKKFDEEEISFESMQRIARIELAKEINKIEEYSSSGENSQEEIIGDEYIDDVDFYSVLLNAGYITENDISLDKEYNNVHGKIINKEITNLMCDGYTIEEMTQPLSFFFQNWGYSEGFASIYLANTFEKRGEVIIEFLKNMHLFTAKDLELEKATQDEEENVIDNIIKRHLIDHVTTEEQMKNEFMIYFMLKGHSNAYINFLMKFFIKQIEEAK